MKMTFGDLQRKMLEHITAKNGLGDALDRFLSVNDTYGYKSGSNFNPKPTFNAARMAEDFKKFAESEYLRTYPSSGSGEETYDSIVKAQYRGMFGPKPKMNSNGVMSSYGDGINFRGNVDSNPTKNAIKANNANVTRPNEMYATLKNGQVKLNKSSGAEYNKIREALGEGKDMSPIAFFDKKGAFSVTENLAGTILYDGGSKANGFAPVNQATAKVTQQAVENLYKGNFYENTLVNLDTLAKTNKSTDLMKQVIKLDQSRNIVTNKSSSMRNLLNFDDMKNSMESMTNILKNGGSFTVFDMEANSGINGLGHTVLNNITEVASVTYDVTKTANGTVAKQGTVFNSVLGFTKSEYDDVLGALKSIESKAKKDWSIEEKVLYDRLNIYDHSEIVDTKGFERQVIKSKGIDEINTSFDGARRGAEKLRNVALSQEQFIKSTGKSYEAARAEYLQSFRDNLQGSLAVGHNVGTYDIPMLNRMTNSSQDIKFLDTLQTAWYSQNELGRTSIYAPGTHIPKGKGPATQEALTTAHGLKDANAAAHIAINDTKENALFMLGEMGNIKYNPDGSINVADNSYFNKVMMPNMQKVSKKLEPTSSTYTGSDQLYYMDYTMQKGYGNMDGALSFEYDPITKSFKTYDGTVIDRKTGESFQAGYNAFGAKKGALYTHDIFEINVDENFKKQFMNMTGADARQADVLFQQYSTAEKLYITRSKEFLDLEALGKKMGSREAAEYYYNNRPTLFNIETNVDRLGANLGVHVADRNGAKVVPRTESLKALGFKETSIGKTGEVLINDAAENSEELMNRIIDKSMDRTINDSAARKVRGLDLKQVTRIRNYQNKLVKENGIKGMNPIATRIAQMVHSNKEISLIDQEEIINALGWRDFKTGDGKLVKETISNTVAMDNHIMQMSPLIDSIMEVLDETYGELKLDTLSDINAISKDSAKKEILLKKDMAFKQLYNDFLDTVVNDPTIENMWKKTIHTSDELNKIDFNLFDVNPDKYKTTMGGWSRNASTEVASLNLNSPNSLINMFYNGKFKDLDGIVSKDGNAGYQSLTDAYHLIRNDKRFSSPDGKKIFDNINIKNFRQNNVLELNDAMMKELRSFASTARSENSSWGYINPRMNQDILNATDLINVVKGMDKDTIKSTLNGLKPNLVKDLMVVDKDNIPDLANKLVKDYFLEFDFKDLDLSGFTDQQKQYAAKQYEVAHRTALNKADSLLNSIKGTDIQLAMTEVNGNKTLNLIQGNQVAQLDSVFKFNHRKGIMTYQLGDNEYALKLGLGFTEKSNSTGRVNTFGFTNSVEKIQARRLDHMNAKWAADRGDNIIDAIVYNNRKMAGELRDASARIDINNGQLFSQGFHFDINELLYRMPQLEEMGVLDKIEKDFGIDEKAIKHMRGVSNKLKEAQKKNTYGFRTKTFNNVMPVDVNFFTDHYMAPLLEYARESSGAFTKDEIEMMKQFKFETKNHALASGYISGTSNYYVDPLARMDNDARPPVTQMQNVSIYDKDKVDKNIKALKGKDSSRYKHVNTESVYTSDTMDKFMYKNKNAIGGVGTNGLTMKYMQIDSYSLRNQFLNKNNQSKMTNYIEKAFGELNKTDAERAKEVILDRAKKLSTYEQQSNMDARLHDVNFHRSNTQTINAKKRMIAEHTDNLEVIDYIDAKKKAMHFTIGPNGEIQYDLGVKVKKGEVLGKFGTDSFAQTVEARFDGVLRGRYFDDLGNVVSEKSLAKIINSAKIDKTNNEEVLKLLDKQAGLSFKYQVLGMEELHGTKVFLGASEKTTIDSMKLRVGEIDSDLAKLLKSKEVGLDDIVGKVVSKDYLDDYVEKHLVSKLGGNKAKEVMNKIYAERYAFSDAIHEIDMFKDVNFITNLDVNKHSSATALMHNALNKLREDGNLTDEYLKKIFGEGTYSIVGEGKNAQVKINENLKEVNLKFEDDEIGKTLTKAFNSKDLVSVDGKSIGYTGVGHLVSVIDDPAGTTAGVFDGQTKGKGVKFTDAMGRNLDRQTYNLDGLNKVYEHYKSIGDMAEFEKIYGHALDMDSYKNGKLAFNDEYRNKSIAMPITSKLRGNLTKTDSGTLLSDVATNPEYKYLVDSVKEGKLGDVTLDKAEMMYSYNRGVEAIDINSAGSNSKAVIERYSDTFREVDWSKDKPDWLDLQIGGQGRTVTSSDMNPYTNNLLIKTGIKGTGDNAGKVEFLAIPRLPEKHVGDSLVQRQYTQSLTNFQQLMQGYKNGTVGQSKVENHILMMKDLLKSDITGKNGLIKDLTENRMEQSFMGKGSGILMLNEAYDGEGKLMKLFGGSANGIDARTAMLDNVNADVFKTATYQGKSLNRHYAEGKVIDSLFMGENAFRDMGYFDNSFMTKTLGENWSNLNESTVASLKKAGIEMSDSEGAMKHLLRTQGDSFISVRYPEIMQGSDKFTMGYLDDSLKANEMRVLGPTGMSAKLDFDGDMMNAARINTTDGLSKLHAATSKNVSEELTNMMSSFDAGITTRAVTDNAYWESKVNEFMSGKKGLKSMSQGMDLEVIASHKLIDGKAYIGSIDKSESELKELYNQYSSTISKRLTDKELIAEVGEENLHDYVAAKSYNDRRNMVTAKVYNNAIGETNVTNQKIKSVVAGFLDKTDSAYEYKSNLLFDFLYQSEEQAISSKSSVSGLTSDRAQQWNTSVRSLFQGQGNRQEHLDNMRGWLMENIHKEQVLATELYYTKSDAFAKKMKDEFDIVSLDDFRDFNKSNRELVDGVIIDDIVDLIDDTSQQKGVKSVYNSLKVASSESGAEYRILQNMSFAKAQDSNLKSVYESLGDIFKDTDNLAKYVDPEISSPKSNKAFRDSIEDLIGSAGEATSKVSTSEKIGDIIEGVGDFAKSMKGKKLAMGAVGIAAGVMVAGYVGGRPRPADAHAMEEAQDYAPMDGHQMLADPGMMMGGGQQGYVININARTDKGRDNAVQALQQAISNGTSSNINIAMNITDNYGNINDREIQKAIEGAFR